MKSAGTSTIISPARISAYIVFRIDDSSFGDGYEMLDYLSVIWTNKTRGAFSPYRGTQGLWAVLMYNDEWKIRKGIHDTGVKR